MCFRTTISNIDTDGREGKVNWKDLIKGMLAETEEE